MCVVVVVVEYCLFFVSGWFAVVLVCEVCVEGVVFVVIFEI